MLLFFQQLNYLVEQRALAFLATRVFLYRFAFSYKKNEKKKCCCINIFKKTPQVCVMSLGGVGVLALLNASGFRIGGGAALDK